MGNGSMATRTCRPRLARCPDGPASRSARQRPPGEHSGPNQEPRGAPGGQINAMKNTTAAVVDKGRGLFLAVGTTRRRDLPPPRAGRDGLEQRTAFAHLYFKVRRK